jgi:hypothetical protein
MVSGGRRVVNSTAGRSYKEESILGEKRGGQKNGRIVDVIVGRIVWDMGLFPLRRFGR